MLDLQKAGGPTRVYNCTIGGTQNFQDSDYLGWVPKTHVESKARILTRSTLLHTISDYIEVQLSENVD
eukprot:COSAG05_NODE_16773_length_339_cov_0.695833_2_plen_68_part_00